MALILSLETSSGICSVALHEDGNLQALTEVHVEQAHASKLAMLIDQVAKAADANIKDIAAVAVSSGPGSYTGLRIGTSTAKGLCFALGVPLIGVETLDLLAKQVIDLNMYDGNICPMIDARRMEVYCSFYDEAGNRLVAVEAKVIDETSFSGELHEGPIIFCGDGAAKCEAVIKDPNAFFARGVRAGAATLGAIAWKRFQSAAFVDLMSFEPFYLKEFKAKLPANLISGSMNKSEA
jgi:tRNA threonylcarbamoyladenosine biosynthesis protein TsaB